MLYTAENTLSINDYQDVTWGVSKLLTTFKTRFVKLLGFLKFEDISFHAIKHENSYLQNV